MVLVYYHLFSGINALEEHKRMVLRSSLLKFAPLSTPQLFKVRNMVTSAYETTARQFPFENCVFDLIKQGFIEREPDQTICVTTGFAAAA